MARLDETELARRLEKFTYRKGNVLYPCSGYRPINEPRNGNNRFVSVADALQYIEYEKLWDAPNPSGMGTLPDLMQYLVGTVVRFGTAKSYTGTGGCRDSVQDKTTMRRFTGRQMYGVVTRATKKKLYIRTLCNRTNIKGVYKPPGSEEFRCAPGSVEVLFESCRALVDSGFCKKEFGFYNEVVNEHLDGFTYLSIKSAGPIKDANGYIRFTSDAKGNPKDRTVPFLREKDIEEKTKRKYVEKQKNIKESDFTLLTAEVVILHAKVTRAGRTDDRYFVGLPGQSVEQVLTNAKRNSYSHIGRRDYVNTNSQLETFLDSREFDEVEGGTE